MDGLVGVKAVMKDYFRCFLTFRQLVRSWKEYNYFTQTNLLLQYLRKYKLQKHKK